MILYPAIDIRGGHAVRLLRGEYERETRYDADPADAARRWAAEGAEYLHVVDLDGARAGAPANLDVIGRIAAAVEIPIQVGGGLRDAGAVEAALAAGARRVVLGTAALLDPDLLDRLLADHGQRVVVAIDARGGEVALAGWTKSSEVDPADAAAALVARGVRRLLFTPIEVDGTMDGPALEELGRLAVVVDAELIYSGGVGSLEHLRSLAAASPSNLGGVVVGRALYEGRFSIEQAKAALKPG